MSDKDLGLFDFSDQYDPLEDARELAAANTELRRKIEALEKEVASQTKFRGMAEEEVGVLTDRLKQVEDALIWQCIPLEDETWLNAAKKLEALAWEKVESDEDATALFLAAAELLIKIDSADMETRASQLLWRNIAQLLQFANQHERAAAILRDELELGYDLYTTEEMKHILDEVNAEIASK